MQMAIDFPLENRLGHQDLYPIFFGSEVCRPGKGFGPYVRSHYLIHYVVEGCGTFISRGKEYKVKRGEIFVIYPNEVNYYCADSVNPWQYIWISFDGIIAQELQNLQSPVVRVSKVNFRAMLKDISESKMPELVAIAYLHALFSEVLNADEKTDYVTRVENEVEAKYYEDISVESLADACSLDRRYLSRIFREKRGITLGQHIINVRIEKAKILLASGTPVIKTAELVGYSDYTVFSKIFRKKAGISAREFAKKTVKVNR